MPRQGPVGVAAVTLRVGEGKRIRRPHPGVQSRHLVDRVQDESIHLGCPDFEDAVIGPETAKAERLGTLSLVPGMPTEICLATERQTAPAYMAKPVMDQVEHALREE